MLYLCKYNAKNTVVCECVNHLKYLLPYCSYENENESSIHQLFPDAMCIVQLHMYSSSDEASEPILCS